MDYPSAWVPRDAISEVAPAVDPAAVASEGAIFNANDGWVDLPSVISVLRREFEIFGGTVIEDAGRCVPVVENGRATAVRTGAGGVLPADAVVVAAGPQSPGVLRDIDVTISDDSPAAFVAFTQPLDHGLSTVLNTPLVAIRPTVDGGLAMDSGWSERSITVDDGGTTHVADQVIERLLAEATKVLAAHPSLELDHIGMGEKPIPGDGEPCIGAIDSVSGLYVAFSHSGATQGLLMGALIAAEVIDGSIDPLTEPFRPGRLTA
ncbi:glycine/D-amino acid oxidase-like deaminating enzyme [Spelaeicoccus albus]|uniref:Glycine/D-amino acid oxidase-like deaminating enzyme n=1 Tax=Spelaeicoccus albus TaxID=1280376 RepID=A0A7Z0IH44_9MICO|nr:glycine/D-amino acid oxidase-like deaminating enzyme [Spelaeicoccus albus]